MKTIIFSIIVFILLLLGLLVNFLPFFIDLYAKILQKWKQDPILTKFKKFPPVQYEKNRFLVISPKKKLKTLTEQLGYDFLLGKFTWGKLLEIINNSKAEFLVITTNPRILNKNIIYLGGDVDIIFFWSNDGIDPNNFILRNTLFTKRKLLSLEKGGELLDQLYTDYIPNQKLGGYEKLPFRLSGITVLPKKLDLNGNLALLNFSDGVSIPEEKINYFRIPKLIFQTMETGLLPKKQLEVMELWKKMNPEYSYHFFDGVSARDFIYNHFPAKVFQAYEKIMPGAYKADLFRYCLLYIYGGVYVDSRCKPLVKLSEFIQERDVMVIPSDKLPCYLWQGFLCCVAKHPVLLASINECVDKILKEDYARNFLDITGPALFGRRVNLYMKRHPETFFREGLLRNIRIITHGFDHSYIRYKNKRIILTKYSHDEQGFVVNTGKEKYGSAWNRKRVYKPD